MTFSMPRVSGTSLTVGTAPGRRWAEADWCLGGDVPRATPCPALHLGHLIVCPAMQQGARLRPSLPPPLLGHPQQALHTHVPSQRSCFAPAAPLPLPISHCQHPAGCLAEVPGGCSVRVLSSPCFQAAMNPTEMNPLLFCFLCLPPCSLPSLSLLAHPAAEGSKCVYSPSLVFCVASLLFGRRRLCRGACVQHGKGKRELAPGC